MEKVAERTEEGKGEVDVAAQRERVGKLLKEARGRWSFRYDIDTPRASSDGETAAAVVERFDNWLEATGTETVAGVNLALFAVTRLDAAERQAALDAMKKFLADHEPA